MTDLRPRPPRIQLGKYVEHAIDHQRICVRKTPKFGYWTVNDFRADPSKIAFPTFPEAWAHVNRLLKETK